MTDLEKAAKKALSVLCQYVGASKGAQTFAGWDRKRQDAIVKLKEALKVQ